jgi:hypothetical protein
MRNTNQKRLRFSVLFLMCAMVVFHTSFVITDGGVSFSWGQEASANFVEVAILGMLNGIQFFLAHLVTAMGVLLTYVIDSETFSAIINDDSVTNSWKMVRDFLNLGFILVLLFSAFATVFQIEKYHIKKILLTLVIMALLVNFSYPISRFVIDSANIPMYHIAEILFGSSANAGADVASRTGINDVLAPNGDASIMEYIAAIVFTFLFAITMGILAIMYLIRLIVLVILVIFSPVGFAAAIFPSTQNYANEYWNTLFKNAFFGPIMMFILAISIYVLDAFQSSDALGAIAQDNSGSTNMAQKISVWSAYFIPIIMLWGGVIWAQKLGAVGASIVISRAQKWSMPIAKGMFWAGTLGHLGGQGDRAYDYVKGVPLGIKKAWYDDPQKRSKTRQENARDIVAGWLPGSGGTRRGAILSVQQKEIARIVKEMEENHVDPTTARGRLTRGSTEQRIAAAQYMAKKEYLQSPDDLVSAVQAAQGDPATLKEISKNLSDGAVSGLQGDQSVALFEALNNEDAKRRFLGLSNSDQDTQIVRNHAQNIRRAFEKEFREKGQIHQIIEMDIQTNINQMTRTNGGVAPSAQQIQDTRDYAYNPNNPGTRLYGRTLSELAKQDVALFRGIEDPNNPGHYLQNQNFRNYLQAIANDPARLRAYQNFYNDLSPEKQQFVPRPQQNP